jgi:group I intron endonuclease
MSSGIYRIRNLINGKIYIGSAVDFERRWKYHKSRLNNNSHNNIHLQNAWNKNGQENFVFEILEQVLPEDFNDKKSFKIKLVSIKEQYYLDKLLYAQDFINKKNNLFLELGYNLNPCASNSLGRVTSEYTKNKISKSLIGKMIGDKNPNYGKKHTIEARKKISDFRKETGISIICITNGITYKSIKEASNILNIKPHNITHVLKGRWKQTKGYVFRYL